MLTCKNIVDTASDYLDGPTTLGQRMSLRFHLMLCKHCRRYLSQLKMISGVAEKASCAQMPSDHEIEQLVEKLKRVDAS